MFTTRACVPGPERDTMKIGRKQNRASKVDRNGQRKLKKGTLEPLRVREDAAGIDVGATELFVAVPPEKDSEPVRRFRSFTRDLYALRLVAAMRGADRGAGIHRGVLDSGIPDPGGAWV
jgi:hypothetical protein